MHILLLGKVSWWGTVSRRFGHSVLLCGPRCVLFYLLLQIDHLR
jgi:hypothetical protein